MEELRKRVIAWIKRGEHKEDIATALRLNLSGVYFIQRLYKVYMETGSFSKCKRGDRQRSRCSDDLIEAIDNKIKMVKGDCSV